MTTKQPTDTEVFEEMSATLTGTINGGLSSDETLTGNGRTEPKSPRKKKKAMANGNSKKTKVKPDLKVVGEDNKAGATPDPKPAEINPFRLEDLVVQPFYKTGVNMVTSAATISVQEKPGPQTFFRTYPDPTYAQIFWGVKWHESEDPSRGEIYVMHPSVQAAMPEEKTFRRYKVYFCMSQTGREFLIAAAMPEDSDKTLWLSSKHEGLEAARSRFLKMFSNQPAGQWQWTYADTDGPETPPNWSQESYQSILMRGFKTPRQDRYIQTLDHFVVRALKGRPPC